MSNTIQNNTTALQDLLSKVNALSDGISLPELSSPGAAADLLYGKQLIDQSGAVVNGTLVELDTSDATAVASDMANGKTAYVNGEKVTGTVTVSKSGSSLPSDYYTIGTSTDGAIVARGKITSDYLVRSGGYTRIEIPATNFGDATAADVTSGKTFTSAAGLKVTGTASMGGEKKVSNVIGISYYDEDNDILKFSLDQNLTTLEALYVSSIDADTSVSLDDLIGDQTDSPEQPAYYLWIKNGDMAIHISASPYRSDFNEQCDDGLVTYTLHGNYITAEMNNRRIGFPWPENLRFINGFAVGK